MNNSGSQAGPNEGAGDDQNVENNRNLRAAMALRKNIEFTVDDEKYEIPNVIDNRYIISELIDQGGFGSIFDCQDSRNFQLYVCKIVSALPISFSCRL
jgi:hypothetical protein